MEIKENNKKIGNSKLILLLFGLLFMVIFFIFLLRNWNANPRKTPLESSNTNKKAVYEEEIHSIVLRYAPFYNIGTAEALNEITEGGYIDIIELKLEGESFSKIAKLISNLTPFDFDMTSCNCAYMIDMVELIVNDDYVISIGDTFGLAGYQTDDNKTLVNVSDIYDALEKIMYEDRSNVFQNLSADTIKIEKNNSIVNITSSLDKEMLLENLSYVPVHNTEDYLDYDTISSIMYLDDDRKLYIYEKSIIGYLWNANGNSYYIVMSSKAGDKYELVVDTIYEKYKKTDFELLGGLKSGESCAQALEPLLVDGKEVCNFNCILSDSYRIKFQDGQEFSIKEALAKKLVTIETLQEKGLPCH